MEIQLQELIEQIKKEGVEAAEGQADTIVSDAKAEADKIIADARAKADKIIADAREESARLTKVSEDAIRQAGRNLLLSFRESVSRELTAVIGEQVAESMAPDTLSALVPKVVESWAKNAEGEELAVLLNSTDLAALEGTLLAAFKEKLLTGVTLKPGDSFTGGFRIAVENGAAYYDYSAEAVTDMLASYLSPKVTALMKEASKN